MTRIRSLVSVLVCVAGLATSAAAFAQSTYFEQAKITVNERARAAGYIRVRIQPENGEPREATLHIERRMSENDIAKGIAASLGAVVGPDYEVDRTAGEHVKIRKARRDVADFAIEIAFSAPGFAIILDN